MHNQLILSLIPILQCDDLTHFGHYLDVFMQEKRQLGG